MMSLDERITSMRKPYLLIAALAALTTGTIVMTPQSKADPYRWCAVYGAFGGGVENCYFVTIGQCRAAISGNGGFCRPNLRYDGISYDSEPRRRRVRRPAY
jgi:hypothetical protein